MNSVFTAKLLNNLKAKKKEGGFTLIELLVVVIIIGVLAAVALPNLLAQVGKARESEGKTAIGTMNRGQQAYHFEAREFAPAINNAALGTITNDLGIAIQSEYFELSTAGGGNDGATPPVVALTAQASANPNSAPNLKTAQENGVRGFAGDIVFDPASGLYGTVVCQAKAIGAVPIPSAATGVGASTCGTDTILK